MAYDVHLEIFEGPLDLLLYLIKKDDMEISEIPIAQITHEYLSFIEAMKDLNLEVAGDFLVMASTLMQIKARMLLPSADGEGEEESPLEELKNRLLEYQKFKEVAQLLGNKENEYSQVFYRPAPAFDKSDFTLEVSLFDLINSFKEVLVELPSNVREIVYEEIPIEQKIREVLDFLEGKDFITFKEILDRAKHRIDLIVSFLAVLELIRLKQVIARQKELFGEVRIYRVISIVDNIEEKQEQFEMPAAQISEDGQEELDFQKKTLAVQEVIPEVTSEVTPEVTSEESIRAIPEATQEAVNIQEPVKEQDKENENNGNLGN